MSPACEQKNHVNHWQECALSSSLCNVYSWKLEGSSTLKLKDNAAELLSFSKIANNILLFVQAGLPECSIYIRKQPGITDLKAKQPHSLLWMRHETKAFLIFMAGKISAAGCVEPEEFVRT